MLASFKYCFSKDPLEWIAVYETCTFSKSVKRIQVAKDNGKMRIWTDTKKQNKCYKNKIEAPNSCTAVRQALPKQRQLSPSPRTAKWKPLHRWPALGSTRDCCETAMKHGTQENAFSLRTLELPSWWTPKNRRLYMKLQIAFNPF